MAWGAAQCERCGVSRSIAEVQRMVGMGTVNHETGTIDLEETDPAEWHKCRVRFSCGHVAETVMRRR